jgi:ferredoxin
MSHKLRVNPIACSGHGVCAELLPEIIEVDPWGYPILRSATVPPALALHARRAVATCPTLALMLERKQAGARSRRLLAVTARCASRAGPGADGRGGRGGHPRVAGHDHGHRELPADEHHLGVGGRSADHVA